MLKVDWKNCRADDGFTGERKRIIFTGDWVPEWDAKTVLPRNLYYENRISIGSCWL